MLNRHCFNFEIIRVLLFIPIGSLLAAEAADYLPSGQVGESLF